MASSCTTIVALLLVLSVTLQNSLACRYFCRNPVTGVYHCCDDGNPYTTLKPTSSQGDDATNTDTNEGAQGTDATNTDGEAVVPTTITVVKHGLEDGAKYSEESGCRYYCSYANSVYCCDTGSLEMPDDHDENHGRCPMLVEQVCKDDAIYLNRKARKWETTKSGSALLSKIGDGEVMCASDGYCAEDERCCPSACHKRHVCVKSVVIDKSKN